MTDPKAYQESWMDRAACAGWPERMFFIEEGSRSQDPDVISKKKKAKRMCAGCPVRRECLTFTLKHERSGSITFGDASFASYWRKTCTHKDCSKHFVRDETPEMKWMKFAASSTPAHGIYGGTEPTQRHRKFIKHVELVEIAGTIRCAKGRRCGGCRDLEEWVSLLMEETG